jgi:16S rRNA (uracil1498-N3)-methyltransferase
MADRYFVETLITGQRAELTGPEAHHLAHVMRGQPGDEVRLFDGSGAEFTARVEQVGRSTIELAVFARREIDRELPLQITMGVALPKGDRQRWLVEKLTELGVFRLVPLVTEHGVAQPVESALARLRRGVIEASKQSGRNRLMEIAPPQYWQDFIASPSPDALRFIAHPESTSATPIPAFTKKAACFAVGPEGGFTQSEIDAALAAGWQAIDLGPRTLRVETAAMALAAAVPTQFKR